MTRGRACGNGFAATGMTQMSHRMSDEDSGPGPGVTTPAGHQGSTLNARRSTLSASDLIPLAWLALTGWAYYGLAAAGWDLRGASIPQVEQAEVVVLPLLALVLGTGIIRYFRGRSPQEDAAAAERAPAAGAGQDTP